MEDWGECAWTARDISGFAGATPTYTPARPTPAPPPAPRRRRRRLVADMAIYAGWQMLSGAFLAVGTVVTMVGALAALEVIVAFV